MKKRLFTMLLLLCLLLTALTATVAAESTNANGGHLEFTFNGRTVTFVLSFNYVCENKHNTHDGYFTYNLNSVQARKQTAHWFRWQNGNRKTPFVQTLPFQEFTAMFAMRK